MTHKHRTIPFTFWILIFLWIEISWSIFFCMPSELHVNHLLHLQQFPIEISNERHSFGLCCVHSFHFRPPWNMKPKTIFGKFSHLFGICEPIFVYHSLHPYFLHFCYCFDFDHAFEYVVKLIETCELRDENEFQCNLHTSVETTRLFFAQKLLNSTKQKLKIQILNHVFRLISRIFTKNHRNIFQICKNDREIIQKYRKTSH